MVAPAGRAWYLWWWIWWCFSVHSYLAVRSYSQTRDGRGIFDGVFDGVSVHSSFAVRSYSQTRAPRIHHGVLGTHILSYSPPLSATLNLLMKMAIAIIFSRWSWKRDVIPPWLPHPPACSPGFWSHDFCIIPDWKTPKEWQASFFRSALYRGNFPQPWKRNGSARALVRTRSSPESWHTAQHLRDADQPRNPKSRQHLRAKKGRSVVSMSCITALTFFLRLYLSGRIETTTWPRKYGQAGRTPGGKSSFITLRKRRGRRSH